MAELRRWMNKRKRMSEWERGDWCTRSSTWSASPLRFGHRDNGIGHVWPSIMPPFAQQCKTHLKENRQSFPFVITDYSTLYLTYSRLARRDLPWSRWIANVGRINNNTQKVSTTSQPNDHKLPFLLLFLYYYFFYICHSSRPLVATSPSTGHSSMINEMSSVHEI